VSIVARYSFTDATYRAGFVEHSPNNSTADAAGDIVVRAGNRMPGVPRHLVKLRVEWSAAESLSIAAGLVAASPQYAHGDENNLDATGRVPGYAVVNLDARWRVTRNVELFVNAANVFDARWQNLGVLGANYFRGPGDTFAPDLAAPAAFRAPGAPFGAWAGLRYRFEGGGT
jgi:outer membrane receptor protein involved in Fe transport